MIIHTIQNPRTIPIEIGNTVTINITKTLKKAKQTAICYFNVLQLKISNGNR